MADKLTRVRAEKSAFFLSKHQGYLANMKIEGGVTKDIATPVLIATTYLITAASVAASYTVQYLFAGTVASGVGGAVAPLLLGGIILGVFKIWKRFRNQKASYMVFLIFQFLFLVSSIRNLLN